MSDAGSVVRIDYSHIEELVRKMVTPDSQNAEPTTYIEKVPVFWYCQNTIDEMNGDEHDMMLDTLAYYRECDIIDPYEAAAYYSVLDLDEEIQAFRISYLNNFWEERGYESSIKMFSWIERDHLTDGIYVDVDYQFWHVAPYMIKNFANEILDVVTMEWEFPCEDDVANLLWALGELSIIDPNYCVNEIAKLHWYWTDGDCLMRFDEMISDFFAQPHITWPDWI